MCYHLGITEGVEHLSLFGSYARGTAVQPLSDVDLMAEFDSTREYSLLDRVRLENKLADMLGVKVDLASARALKDQVANTPRARLCLSFRDADSSLTDIADVIELIEEFTPEMDFDPFRADPKRIGL
jgi:predicted nucleotidyltransferase